MLFSLHTKGGTSLIIMQTSFVWKAVHLRLLATVKMPLNGKKADRFQNLVIFFSIHIIGQSLHTLPEVFKLYGGEAPNSPLPSSPTEKQTLQSLKATLFSNALIPHKNLIFSSALGHLGAKGPQDNRKTCLAWCPHGLSQDSLRELLGQPLNITMPASPFTRKEMGTLGHVGRTEGSGSFWNSTQVPSVCSWAIVGSTASVGFLSAQGCTDNGQGKGSRYQLRVEKHRSSLPPFQRDVIREIKDKAKLLGCVTRPGDAASQLT